MQQVVTSDTDDNRQHLLLACVPKSGSTFLATVLAGLPNFNNVSLTPAYGSREQEIDAELARYHANKSYVAQHHVRNSEHTRRIICEHNINTIVLVRNIFDIVASFRDHMRNESVIFPMAYAFQESVSWADKKLEEFISDMVIPWYFNFYVGWTEAEDKFMITYEQLLTDPFDIVTLIRGRYGIICTDAEIQGAITRAQLSPTRKNVAKVGRGKSISNRARNHIHEMARYYRGVDLRPLGLGRSASAVD